MRQTRSIFLAPFLILVAGHACADGDGTPPIPSLHIQIVDAGQKAVYDGVLKDLPDARGIPGEWVKQEAIRSALERDPELALRALQMVAHPDQVPITDQMAATQEQFDLAMNLMKSASFISLPGVTGISVGSFAQFADASRAIMAYEMKQQGIDPEQAKRDVMNMIENQPGVMDSLVGHVHDNLSNPLVSSDLLSMDGKLRGQLEGLIKEGKLPDINGDQQHLVDGLQPNTVTEKLASLLAEFISQQIADMRGDQTKTCLPSAESRSPPRPIARSRRSSEKDRRADRERRGSATQRTTRHGRGQRPWRRRHGGWASSSDRSEHRTGSQ